MFTKFDRCSTGPRTLRYAPFAALWALSAVLWAQVAAAHVVNLSQSDFTIAGSHVHALVVFAKLDAARLGRMDPNQDGIVSAEELAASEAVFRVLVERALRVEADGRACTPTLEGGGDVEGDGFGLAVSYACPEAARRLALKLDVLRELLPGHRHILHVQAGETNAEAVLTPEETSFEIDLQPVSREPAPISAYWLRTVRMGVEHILTGWDHLLFIFALLLGASNTKQIVIALSAFTVAHSITLAVAAFGILAPSPRFVEPAIAASIAYVACMNLWAREAPHRWRVTFAFGLVHGFGFAGALRELALARERLVVTLVGFNIGVELGQLLVVVAVVPLLALTLRRARKEMVVRVLSTAVAVIGAVVFVLRAFSA